MYAQRALFEYDDWQFIYPMNELPYWRMVMERRRQVPRWRSFSLITPALLDEVRGELRARGPLGNRDFNDRAKVHSYRGRKDSALALYYLWLTGELMIHHRDGFERIYDFRNSIVPPQFECVAPEAEAEDYFAHKALDFLGLARERQWAYHLRGLINRKIDPQEGNAWLARFAAAGEAAQARLEGSKDAWWLPAADLPLLDALENGAIPPQWTPLGSTTRDEAVILAPLDIVCTRGRAVQMFDFDYVWEVYKPVELRRWGYYTLPILYGDRLVARVDPKLDRKRKTLCLNGFWTEPGITLEDPAFAAALQRGLASFAAFAGARQIEAGPNVSIEILA
jgi:uncharacterized protein YcaQ